MKKISITLFLILLAGIVSLPVILTVTASVKSGYELKTTLLPILAETQDAVSWHIFPLYPTLEHYIKLLFQTPQFFTVFWNSIKMTVLILGGQMLVGIPAAWAFAVFSFRGKKILFTIYVLLMLMPFQVTMLSSYLAFERLHLMDTQGAVVLPAIFSTFPVFLMYRGFRAIPVELLEAARVDGAEDLTILFRIGIPLGLPGILSALVLGFLDYWNMIEQPLAFLKTKSLWPLSLYLPEIGTGQAGSALAAAVIALLPAAFVFAIGQDYLEQGIIATGLKD